MNKSAKTGLILSLAANVALFAGFAAGYISIKKSTAVVQLAVSDNALSPEAAKETKSLLTTDDMASLRDQLRALGLPEDTVKEIVRARVASRYTARLREIGNEALEAARQAYWRPQRHYTGYLTGYSSELSLKIFDIEREEAAENTQLFGTDKTSNVSAYPFLGPEKAAQLARLQSDYNDLVSQASKDMAGFRMPGDEGKIKLIKVEQERDTLALLTPEEKEDYDLRTSPTAWRMHMSLAGFDMTEDEYKTIFDLEQVQDEKFFDGPEARAAINGGADFSDFYKARSDAQKTIDAQIKDMLGDERYADYLRGQRQDYQSLQAAAQRFNLDADTVAQTYQARDDAASQAKQISDDASLSAEQKNEAYAALAEQATGQIKAALGDEVGDAYINNALGWLKNLPKGGTVTVDAKGNVKVTQPKQTPPAQGQGRGDGG